MKNFKTKIDGFEEEFDFECYDNTEIIEVGDAYLFFFAGIADVQICVSDNMKYEINPNNHKSDDNCVLDFVSGFWKNCYKIKNTNFDITVIKQEYNDEQSRIKLDFFR